MNTFECTTFISLSQTFTLSSSNSGIFTSLLISSLLSRGILSSASSLEGSDWYFFRAIASSYIFFNSSFDNVSLNSASFSLSSLSFFVVSPFFGVIVTIAVFLLSSRCFFIRFSKYPFSTSSLSVLKIFSNLRCIVGSAS